jgi:magnesium transporter
MLNTYDLVAGALKRREGEPRLAPETAWIDLVNPSAEEERHVEEALKLDIPTREELQEIEASSRLYQEDGARFMTATLLLGIDAPKPVTTTVTFILTDRRLVTVRYAEPYSFEMFATRTQKGQLECATPAALLAGLLEIIVDRHADLVERIQREMDHLTDTIFNAKRGRRTSSSRFEVTLKSIGHEGDLIAKARESLTSILRLLTYFSQAVSERKDDKAVRARIKTAQRDVQSVADHVQYLQGQIVFLLDATLGMISMQQNAIIKFFSVVAVVFLPPTLIASIYGMNFHGMPEIDWPWGYPMALLLMVISAVLPVWWFRRQGWR